MTARATVTATATATPVTACHAPNGTYACQRLTGHPGPHRARDTVGNIPYLSRWEHSHGPVRTVIDRP